MRLVLAKNANLRRRYEATAGCELCSRHVHLWGRRRHRHDVELDKNKEEIQRELEIRIEYRMNAESKVTFEKKCEKISRFRRETE